MLDLGISIGYENMHSISMCIVSYSVGCILNKSPAKENQLNKMFEQHGHIKCWTVRLNVFALNLALSYKGIHNTRCFKSELELMRRS